MSLKAGAQRPQVVRQLHKQPRLAAEYTVADGSKHVHGTCARYNSSCRTTGLSPCRHTVLKKPPCQPVTTQTDEGNVPMPDSSSLCTLLLIAIRLLLLVRNELDVAHDIPSCRHSPLPCLPSQTSRIHQVSACYDVRAATQLANGWLTSAPAHSPNRLQQAVHEETCMRQSCSRC